MFSSSIRHLADSTTRDLSNHVAKAGETIGKIASGKRSPTTKNDVVSLAISNQLSSEIKAIGQGVRNLSQGSSVINVAAGGVMQISDVLSRLKTLAVQASSDVLGGDGRALVNEEFRRLSETVDSIANSVRFSGTKLVSGGKVESAIKSGGSFIGANAGKFEITGGAVIGFIDLQKTQSTPLADGYVNFSGSTQSSSVNLLDNGNLRVVLGTAAFEVNPSDVKAGAALIFREIGGESYFSLQLSSTQTDIDAIDTRSELQAKLKEFFADSDTIIKVGTQPSLGSGWTRVKYDEALLDNEELFTAGAVGKWRLPNIRQHFNETSFQVSPAVGGLSGPVEEVYAATAGTTSAISIKIGNELFVSTVDSLNDEVLNNLSTGASNNQKIVFQSIENSEREIIWTLGDDIQNMLPDAAGTTNAQRTQALAEGIGFAIGAKSVRAGATVLTRIKMPANPTYTDYENGASTSIARYTQEGAFGVGKKADAIGFYTNFNVEGANPNSIGADYLLNTARTRGNIEGLVESVTAERTAPGSSSYNVTAVIGGRTFMARGFVPENQTGLTPNTTTIAHGADNNLTISNAGFFNHKNAQTLDLIDVSNSGNQISLNLAHNAGSVLNSVEVLQTSLEELFGVGVNGQNTSPAEFTSGRAVHDGVNGFVSAGDNKTVTAFPGTHEGTYYVSYDAQSKTFSMSGNGENWKVSLEKMDKVDNYISFGNGISLNLGQKNNEFDPEASLGQFAIEVTHNNIKSYEFQVGSQQDDLIAFKLGGLSAEALGLDKLSINSKETAFKAQQALDGALIGLNNILTSLGSQQSYTELAIMNLNNISIWSKENRAVFADADLAEEIINFNKENVISQAAASMVRQAQQMFSQMQDILR